MTSEHRIGLVYVYIAFISDPTRTLFLFETASLSFILPLLVFEVQVHEIPYHRVSYLNVLIS